MEYFSHKGLATTLTVMAIAVGASMLPAGAQENAEAPEDIPYYWETRPATSAAVVAGLQRAELQCGVAHQALAGSAIMCAITGGNDDENSEPDDQAAAPAEPQRVPTFGETLESILTGPR